MKAFAEVSKVLRREFFFMAVGDARTMAPICQSRREP